MNKRQRKKRRRKASRRFWSLMDDPDLDQFMRPDTVRGNGISPSRQSNHEFGCAFGFGRIFSGDQSRRDRFPSPYLPDGQENPEYGYLTQHWHLFYSSPLREMVTRNG